MKHNVQSLCLNNIDIALQIPEIKKKIIFLSFDPLMCV